MPPFKQLAEKLSTDRQGHSTVLLDGAKPYFIAALYHELRLPILVLTSQPENARKIHEQLLIWCPSQAELFRFPELDFLPFESGQLSLNTYQTVERLKTLAALAFSESEDKPPLVIASVLAAMTKTIRCEEFVAACDLLKPGMDADPLELMRRWQSLGYEIVELVEAPGQMSRRGGIVDLFPPSSLYPVRIDFFGKHVENMRYFDPETQRSNQTVSSLIVIPAKEFMMAANKMDLTLTLDSCTSEARRRFAEDLDRLCQGQWFPGIEFYFPLLNKGNIFDYLSDDALLVLDDPQAIELAVARLNKEARELRAVKIEKGELPSNFPSPYLSQEEFETRIRDRNCLALETWGNIQSETQALPFSLAPSYGGQLEKFINEAKQMLKEKRRILLVTHQANRLATLLDEEGIQAPSTLQIERIPLPGSIVVIQGSLQSGWIMDHTLSLFTDAELFGFVKKPRPSRRTAAPKRWFSLELTPGDYVVHVDHGIARFQGLIRISSDEIEREYLVLEYAAGDRLYVPTDRIDRVSRYIGAADQAPTLSRLRTPDWQKTKRRVKESVAKIAQELLELYAAREVTPGFAFSPDSIWQQELEASFPYIETPDQMEAIQAVKKDLEKPKPMDRLICGDVGYGKTEIALRAAFKAVMDNKQVAILVPTTVLAQQHYITFSERLQTFPVKVEMLSRFCSPEKERQILEGLANGTVDICIGTHRLLQKDVIFKDLGLVIIDEEQQFGVIQKERLKQMRKEVDTLALSATPIPRTLYMSLTGIRDMSVVETPPADRLAVKTYVGEYDATLVRQVILRELERNGQVFFVHNRVQSIGLVANKLKNLVPEARIATAHGQMPEEQLEQVMSDFVAGKYDVLVSTTIVQLGLDMPNVNTLIVDQADKFGLAQLYQLRGRVGRGINQAYAYFFFDKEKQLTLQAQKRLKTIFEATELGAGFGIAMKDLEIRGAGNLLGVRQSGHINSVGFDLYCQLLAEAVEELKAKQRGEVCKKVPLSEADQRPSIDLPLAAHIPEEYVSDLNTRLGIYHRLARMKSLEEISDLTQEFVDRFGALPEPVENLLYMMRIKVLATKAKISSVSTQGKLIVIKPQESIITDEVRQFLSRSYDGAVRTGAAQIRLDARLLGNKWKLALEEVLNFCVKYNPGKN